MLPYRHLTYFRGTPERVALFNQASGGSSQYISDEMFFPGENLADVHWLVFNV